MVKKYFIFLFIVLLCLTGCSNYNVNNIKGEFKKNVNSSKSYKLDGIMEINNGEETFTYSLEVNYLKDDFYKVILVNQINNHEQVILKNKDGLYVVTPSLNKSFKFDSIWPENSSQAYLLKNILDDMMNDNNAIMEENDNKYIVKCKVNYPNNEDLLYQKIYFDKNVNVEKVEVYDRDNNIKIKVKFKNVNLKARLHDDDFKLEDLIDNTIINDSEDCVGEECDNKVMSSLDEIIYPLYIPNNTHLTSSEQVDSENGGRVILTFNGDKNFVIVEEISKISNEFEVIPVFGEPLIFNESVGAISPNSISWNASNISYYLVGNDLSSSEMVNIASSLGYSKTTLLKK